MLVVLLASACLILRLHFRSAKECLWGQSTTVKLGGQTPKAFSRGYCNRISISRYTDANWSGDWLLMRCDVVKYLYTAYYPGSVARKHFGRRNLGV
ncbi:hypothetical protein EV426DRAFT_605206 [Tirmania nivea]|nr:hypothetical protein EV426DRAFT_605206 [Tirmania nivea]